MDHFLRTSLSLLSSSIQPITWGSLTPAMACDWTGFCPCFSRVSTVMSGEKFHRKKHAIPAKQNVSIQMCKSRFCGIDDLRNVFLSFFHLKDFWQIQFLCIFSCRQCSYPGSSLRRGSCLERVIQWLFKVMEKMSPFTGVCCHYCHLATQAGVFDTRVTVTHIHVRLLSKTGWQSGWFFAVNRVSGRGAEGEEVQKVTHYVNKSVSKWDCSGKEKVDVDKKDPLSFPQQINLFYQWKLFVPWFNRLEYVFKYTQTVVSGVQKKYFKPWPWPLVLVLLLQFYLSM